MKNLDKDKEEIKNLVYSSDILHFLPKDPFVDKSFKTLFRKTLPVEVRMESSNMENQVATNEKLLFIISKREETLGKSVLMIRLESKKDVYFQYQCQIDIDTYSILKEINGLSSNFNQFISGTADLFVKIFKKPFDFLLIFFIDDKGAGRLEITQNFDYKVNLFDKVCN